MQSFLSPEVAGGGTVVGFGAAAQDNEAAFADEATEKGGDPLARQGEFKGEGDILVGDGVVRGKELREDGVNLGVIHVEYLTVGRLIHRDAAYLL